MKVFLGLVLTCVAVCSARPEPPAPVYGPPSADYASPAETYSAPSSAYGAPASSAGVVSSRIRGSGRRLALSRKIGAARQSLSSVYGAPGGGYNYHDALRARLAQDDLSEPANYDFSYAVEDGASGSDFGHQESRQDESAVGEYRVALPDGRTLIVEYEANENGYNPRIRYEEPAGRYAASNRNLGGPYQK